MKKAFNQWFFFLILALTVVSCSTLMQLNVFPVSKDIELGAQFDSEIRNNPKEYPLLSLTS